MDGQPSITGGTAPAVRPPTNRKRVAAQICGVALGLVGALALAVTPSIRQAREAARRTSCKCGMKQFGLALHNYHDKYGCFPPAFVRGPDGRAWHSWRVLILPYFDNQSLYNQYNFSEPWDGPNNKKLLTKMPACFACPSRPRIANAGVLGAIPHGLLACSGHPPSMDIGFTSYAAVLGPNCVFRGVKPTAISDIPDGTSNTLLIGECGHARIPWTKPDDIEVSKHPKIGDPDGFSSYHRGGCQFLLCDGTVRFINLAISQSLLDALYTRNGGETVGDF
jgi:hypothetical protein